MRQFSDPFSNNGNRNGSKDMQMAPRGNASGSSSATMQNGTPGSGQHDGSDAPRPNPAATAQQGARPSAPRT
jgi:hypothetical protein